VVDGRTTAAAGALGGGSDGQGESGSSEKHADGGGVTGTTEHYFDGAKRPPHVAPNGKNAGNPP
jgi:hypothetical protein